MTKEDKQRTIALNVIYLTAYCLVISMYHSMPWIPIMFCCCHMLSYGAGRIRPDSDIEHETNRIFKELDKMMKEKADAFFQQHPGLYDQVAAQVAQATANSQNNGRYAPQFQSELRGAGISQMAPARGFQPDDSGEGEGPK